MKEMNVSSLGGLHHELYHPHTDDLNVDRVWDRNNPTFLNLNALFWAQHFDRERVRSLITFVVDSATQFSAMSPQLRAVVSAPDMFLDQVLEARDYLCDQGATPQEFFGRMETLFIVCRMYSDYIYHPHVLTLHDGFLTDDSSSLALLNQCLIPSMNPYLDFIRQHTLPVFHEYSPDVLWLNGRITMATMAIARLARKTLPQIKIFVVGHSSEYYSLNKIVPFLLENDPLFSVINGIVLDSAEQTRQTLIRTLSRRESLKKVDNLLYASQEGDSIEIHQSAYRRYSQPQGDRLGVDRRKRSQKVKLSLDPAQVANVKLFPDRLCPWNRCTFCGINQKYHTLPEKDNASDWGVDRQIALFRTLEQEGCSYIWAIDEAIPAAALRHLAQGIVDNGIKIKWQARTRIDKDLLRAGMGELLALSGLRELRMGLESASYRILSLMDKFSDDFSLELVESLVAYYHNVGIGVHFPMIIGFPTETNEDRRQTYDFLSMLRRRYPSFSFNINILGLDVSSKLYREWESFGITAIRFPCAPQHFLGNLVDWDCTFAPFDQNSLEMERNALMRRELYPWIPETALVQPHVFYRLSETLRNTLVWRDRQKDDGKTSLKGQSILRQARDMTFVPARLYVPQELDLYYHFKTHDQMKGTEHLKALLDCFNEPSCPNNVMEAWQSKKLGEFVDLDWIENNILNLYKRGFLVDAG